MPVTAHRRIKALTRVQQAHRQVRRIGRLTTGGADGIRAKRVSSATFARHAIRRGVDLELMMLLLEFVFNGRSHLLDH